MFNATASKQDTSVLSNTGPVGRIVIGRLREIGGNKDRERESQLECTDLVIMGTQMAAKLE
jgi:hypothetical protein